VDGVYFGGGRTAEEFAALAAESGADAVNWPLRAGYADPADAASWDRCAALLGEAALDVVSLAASGQNSAIAGEEAAFRAEIAQGVEAARTLACDLIDCWPRMEQGAAKPDSQKVLTANIEAVAGLLAANGMVISFEFEPDTTIERYAEALDFLRPLPSVARLTADTYHINRAGDDLVASAQAMAGRFGILHISGSHRGEPGSEGDTCDHEGFVRAAREAGYTGDLVLQYAPPPDALDSLKRAVALCQRIIERTS
jgi:sugar phosphate isomerase/epimerase